MLARKTAVCLAGALATMLSGCGKVQVKSADKCFPKAALRWMVPTARPGASSVAAAEKAVVRATIYVDRSGSMTGYVDGATNTERPLQDIVSTLPTMLGVQNVQTEFRTFGTSISEVLPDGGARLQTRDIFTCQAAAGKACDNTESHLDRVLAEADRKPGELSVIISDLWFANSEIDSTGIAALQPALVNILLSGRVIAVYGIDAPFSGKIYDLPQVGTGTFSVPYSGRHPLFMLVIGPKAAVVGFGDGLEASGSRFLAEGMANGKIRRSLFATDPGPDVYSRADPLAKGNHPRVVLDYAPVPLGVQLQRFAMTLGLPTPPGGRAAPVAPRWTGPDPAYFLKDAVWRGPTVGQTHIWKRGSDACTWIDQGIKPDGWVAEADMQQSFTLDPDQLRSTFSNKGTYLVVGETRRTELTQPNPASEWMRSGWNLAPEAAVQVSRSAPAVFPTLNLSEFGRIMEGALAIAAKQSNQPIIGFATMVTIKD